MRKKTLSGKTGKLQENPLVEKIRPGDREAFDQFLCLYQNRVYYTALRMLRQHEEALDAAQEVFLKIWLKARSIRKGEKITSFQDESDKKKSMPRTEEQAWRQKCFKAAEAIPAKPATRPA